MLLVPGQTVRQTFGIGEDCPLAYIPQAAGLLDRRVPPAASRLCADTRPAGIPVVVCRRHYPRLGLRRDRTWYAVPRNSGAVQVEQANRVGKILEVQPDLTPRPGVELVGGQVIEAVECLAVPIILLPTLVAPAAIGSESVSTR